MGVAVPHPYGVAKRFRNSWMIRKHTWIQNLDNKSQHNKQANKNLLHAQTGIA